MQFYVRYLSSIIFLPLIFSVVSVNAQSQEMEEVIVTGIKASLEKAIEQKRNADSLVEIITSEDIGKFPDSNVAESLQRITGVQINRGESGGVGDVDGSGEGSQVSVRGTPPELNTASLNGQTLAIASYQGGTRAFNFSTLSPGMIESLEVFKTPQADQDEGAIGASINVKTRNPLSFNKRKVSLTLKRMQDELADDSGNKFNFLFGDKFEVSSGQEIGVLFGRNYYSVTRRRDSLESFGYRYLSYDPSTQRIADVGAPVQVTSPDPALQYGFMPKDFRQNIRLEDQKRSNDTASLAWQPSDDLQVRLDWYQSDFERDESASNNVFRFTDAPGPLSATRIEGVELSGDNFIAANNSKSTNGNHRRYFIAMFERVHPYSTSTKKLTVDFDIGAWKTILKVGESDGKGLRDPSIFTQFGPSGDNVGVVSYRMDGSSKFPSASIAQSYEAADFSFFGLSRAVLSNEDSAKSFQLDFERNVDLGPFSSVKLGLKAKDRERLQTKAIDSVTNRGATRERCDNQVCNLSNYLSSPTFPVDNFSVTGGLPANWLFPSGDLIVRDYPFEGGDANSLSDPIVRPRQDGLSNWDIAEETTSAYVMASFDTDKIRGNFGIRFIDTDQLGNANSYDSVSQSLTPITDSRSYTDTLPSLNIVYLLSDDLLIRAGLAKVMSRPKFTDLMGGYNINIAANTAVRGNPNIEPYRANSFDLSLEWYFEEGSLFSAAVFSRDIGTFSGSQQTSEIIPGFEDEGEFLVSSPFNGEGAELQGFEFSFQTNLTMLPEPLNNLGLQTNYTYTDSETANLDAFGNVLPLEGTSETSTNFSLFYEDNQFSGRISYAYRDDWLIFSSSLGRLPVYHKATAYVDANFSYKVANTNLILIAEATNLGNETPITFAGDESRIISYREYGRRFEFGARYSF